MPIAPHCAPTSSAVRWSTSCAPSCGRSMPCSEGDKRRRGDIWRTRWRKFCAAFSPITAAPAAWWFARSRAFALHRRSRCSPRTRCARRSSRARTGSLPASSMPPPRQRQGAPSSPQVRIELCALLVSPRCSRRSRCLSRAPACSGRMPCCARPSLRSWPWRGCSSPARPPSRRVRRSAAHPSGAVPIAPPRWGWVPPGRAAVSSFRSSYAVPSRCISPHGPSTRRCW